MPFVVDTSVPLPATLSPGGGMVGGLKTVRARVEEARNRRAALVGLLPDGTPDDWVAIGSLPLFDEYERKLREIGQKLDPAPPVGGAFGSAMNE
jgi:hypothetical protein